MLQDSCQSNRPKIFAGQNKNLPVLSDSPAVLEKTVRMLSRHNDCR